MHHGLGEEPSTPVNRAGAPQSEDGEKLLPEPGEGVEVAVVDRRVRADLGVVRDVAVGELAADDVGVGGEGGVGGGGDFDVVGDAGVVVAAGFVSCCVSCVLGWYGGGTNIMTGIGLRSAMAWNHFTIPSCVTAPAK